jgi:hypothetical protein
VGQRAISTNDSYYTAVWDELTSSYQIRVYDLTSGIWLRTLALVDAQTVGGIAVSTDGTRVVVDSYDSNQVPRLEVLDSISGAPVATLTGVDRVYPSTLRLTFCPDGKTLWSQPTSGRPNLSVFRTSDWTLLQTFDQEVGWPADFAQPHSMAFVDTGQMMAYGRGDASLVFAENPYYVDGNRITSVTINPFEVQSGGLALGTVSIAAALSKDAVVSLASNRPEIVVPSTVTIRKGQTQATFLVNTNFVDNRISGAVSAKRTGTGAYAQLIVKPATLDGIEFPTPVVGGRHTRGFVRLTGPSGPSGTVVNLRSYVPALMTVPASITVPAGMTEATFTATTTTVSETTVATAKAFIGGVVRNAPLTVLAQPDLNGWSLVGTNPNPMLDLGYTPANRIPGATDTVTSRLMHGAATQGQTATRVRLVYANYRNTNGLADESSPNFIRIKAALERLSPEGPTVQDQVPVPVTFGGSETIEIAPGEYVVSDPIDFPLEDGQRFFTRTMQWVYLPTDQMVGGLTTSGGATYEASDYGEGAAPGDLTYTGTITPGVVRGVLSPVAILGETPTPLRTLAVCGDSIMAGADDAGFRANGGGFGERVALRQTGRAEDSSIVPYCGYVRLARGGELVKGMVQSQLRFDLSCMATTILENYLNNDLGDVSANNPSTVQLKADMVAAVKRWTDRGKTVIVTTITPRMTSTDGFTSTLNQTPRQDPDIRESVNDWLRDPAGLVAEVGAPEGMVRIWDIAGFVEATDEFGTPMPEGYWKAEPLMEDQGVVSSPINLSTASFRDRSRTWVENKYRGYTVMFLEGAAAMQSRTIRNNQQDGRFTVRTALKAVPAEGDHFGIFSGILTSDGVHPTSDGHRMIAARFDYERLMAP